MSNNDRFTVRAVVVFLGAGMLIGLVGLIWLVSRGTADAAMIGIVAGPTGTALGALGTLLARTSVEPPLGAVPQPVTIENPPSAPVPVVQPEPVAVPAAAVG